jgi:hypothetical protein
MRTQSIFVLFLVVAALLSLLPGDPSARIAEGCVLLFCSGAVVGIGIEELRKVGGKTKP